MDSVSLVDGHIDPDKKEMTPQEALAWVEDYEKAIKEEQAFLNNGDEFHIEALSVCEVVKQALEKQIPKKPLLKETKCFDGSTDDFIFICPVCNRNICIAPEDDEIASYIKEEYPHCNCGQALDWSDTE